MGPPRATSGAAPRGAPLKERNSVSCVLKRSASLKKSERDIPSAVGFFANSQAPPAGVSRRWAKRGSSNAWAVVSNPRAGRPGAAVEQAEPGVLVLAGVPGGPAGPCRAGLCSAALDEREGTARRIGEGRGQAAPVLSKERSKLRLRRPPRV